MQNGAEYSQLIEVVNGKETVTNLLDLKMLPGNVKHHGRRLFPAYHYKNYFKCLFLLFSSLGLLPHFSFC